MENKYIFVEHSQGTFEGNSYDSIILSDGTLAFKAKNHTKLSSLPFTEGEAVLVTLSIKGSKKCTPVVAVTSIKSVK